MYGESLARTQYLSAFSSKLVDVLILGAGLDFGLALAPNMSGSTYSSVSVNFAFVVVLRFYPVSH